MVTTQGDASGEQSERPGPARSYAIVLVLELIVLTGLFWLGRHFG
jgi:hypothetical protein